MLVCDFLNHEAATRRFPAKPANRHAPVRETNQQFSYKARKPFHPLCALHRQPFVAYLAGILRKRRGAFSSLTTSITRLSGRRSRRARSKAPGRKARSKLSL